MTPFSHVVRFGGIELLTFNFALNPPLRQTVSGSGISFYFFFPIQPKCVCLKSSLNFSPYPKILSIAECPNKTRPISVIVELFNELLQRGKTAFRFLPLNIEIPVEHKYDTFDIKLSHNNEMIAFYHGKDLKVCTFPDMNILANFSNIDYGRVSFSPDDNEILIASHKGFIYKLN